MTKRHPKNNKSAGLRLGYQGLNSNKTFSIGYLLIFIIVFAGVGAYILLSGKAATINCSSYPTVPTGTASINLCPSAVDHTLPAKFWGYGFSQYYYNDIIQPGYQQLFKQVAPEVIRNQIGKAANNGTPTSPNILLKNMYGLSQTMKSQGLNLGVILNMESGPASLPSTVSPAATSNYDNTGNRSPANEGALTNWFMDGGIDVLGVEFYNEPGGNEKWYTQPSGYTGQLYVQERENWANVHQRQYADGVHQALNSKGRSAKIIAGVQGTGEGYGESRAQDFFCGCGTTVTSGGGWPWSTDNLGSTSSGPIFDVYDFHPYPAGDQSQSGLNSLAYPTLTWQHQSSLLAFMETARSYLNSHGASSKQLAFDEGGFDSGTNIDALGEGVYAVLSARNQAHWNLPYYTLWSSNTNTVAGASIWPLFLTTDHVNFRNTIRSSAARDITGKFLHNYKRQMTGYNVATVNGSGMTPGGAYSNPVQRIQASAGLSADGTKMAVLAVNMDLTNPQPFQINLGTTPAGAITATYMLENTPVGNIPTASISTSSTSFTRTLEPGSEYLFEIPISTSTSPAPTVSLTPNPTAISAGGSSTLTWSSTNSTSCSAGSPSGWTASTATSDSQTITPASTTTYSIICTGSGGSASASTTVTVNQAASITLPAATVNHTIDGNLNESDWKLSTTINHMVSGSTTDTGSWGASWDNNYLYVGVKVNDNNLSTAASFTATNYWQNDSVELYVDPNADKGTTYDANDKQLAAVWNNPGLYGLSGEVTPGVQHAWANVTGGYSIEFAIPWSSLGVTPSNNMKLGLDIGINDSVNNARVGQLMWNGTSNNYQDPSNFGLVTLTGTPAIVQGDLNGDGHVTITDLSMLLTNYGTSNSVADINGDGLVNILDLSILLSNYGK
jgi:hypothetical protein